MSNRRIQPTRPQVGAQVFEDGEHMFNGILLGTMGNGIEGVETYATQLGANRWQTNVASSMRNVWGPLSDPNLFVYPANRWRTYLHDYIGPKGVDKLRMAMRMGIAGHGDATFMTHVKVHHQGMRAHNEKGNCFLGISFRSKPDPAVTMLSRTVTLTPMGLLDIAFGQLLAREWWKIVKTSIPPTFNWYTGSVCVTPFHSTIILGKLGLFYTELDESEVTLRDVKKTEKLGGPWPGKHRVIYPEDFDTYPKMLQDSIKLSDKFIQADDYDRSVPERTVYAQYVRMQRKLRLWLWGEERIKPWVPVLPSEWFEDLYGMTKDHAKRYEKYPLPEFGKMSKTDFPKGKEIKIPRGTNAHEYYSRYTTEEISWEELV